MPNIYIYVYYKYIYIYINIIQYTLLEPSCQKNNVWFVTLSLPDPK